MSSTEPAHVELANLLFEPIGNAKTEAACRSEIRRFDKAMELLSKIMRRIVAANDRIDAAIVVLEVEKELDSVAKSAMETLEEMTSDKHDGRAPQRELAHTTV
jgi:hypothetical protein